MRQDLCTLYVVFEKYRNPRVFYRFISDCTRPRNRSVLRLFADRDHVRSNQRLAEIAKSRDLLGKSKHVEIVNGRTKSKRHGIYIHIWTCTMYWLLEVPYFFFSPIDQPVHRGLGRYVITLLFLFISGGFIRLFFFIRITPHGLVYIF